MDLEETLNRFEQESAGFSFNICLVLTRRVE